MKNPPDKVVIPLPLFYPKLSPPDLVDLLLHGLGPPRTPASPAAGLRQLQAAVRAVSQQGQTVVLLVDDIRLRSTGAATRAPLYRLENVALQVPR
jgi:hypothetical protein